MKIVHRILLVFLLVLGWGSAIFAKTPEVPLKEPAEEQKKIDYIMPYPGVLPDHPLYRVKLVRDRLLDFLIVEPTKKAEFFILQADKRLMMGVLLLDKGNESLAEQTISKGEAYLSKAAGKLVSAKESGKEIPDYLYERIEGSTAKHEEILSDLFSRAPESVAAGLAGSLGVLQETAQTVAELR